MGTIMSRGFSSGMAQHTCLVPEAQMSSELVVTLCHSSKGWMQAWWLQGEGVGRVGRGSWATMGLPNCPPLPGTLGRTELSIAQMSPLRSKTRPKVLSMSQHNTQGQPDSLPCGPPLNTHSFIHLFLVFTEGQQVWALGTQK
jgi:hypothetical protein